MLKLKDKSELESQSLLNILHVEEIKYEIDHSCE